MRAERIARIQQEFGYDWEDCERIFEYQAFKANQMCFNFMVGAFAAYKVGPFQDKAA